MSEDWLRREWIGPGMDLVVQGERSGGQLYVLRAGQLEIIRDGQHVTVIRTPGAVIGEMGVLLETPHTATVRAMTETDLYVIDNALEILRAHPDWLLQIARLLAQRVNATTALFTQSRQEDSLVLPEHLLTSWGDPTL